MTKTCKYFDGKLVSLSDWNDWRWQVEHSCKCFEELKAISGLGCDELNRLSKVTERYPFRVTPYYWSLIDWNSHEDPVRRQCIPDLREIELPGGGLEDPFEERCKMPVPGLIHRFRDRVLVITTNKCAVYCRHCTRKNILSGLGCVDLHQKYFDSMLDYVSGDDGIREVIISGGEPLLMDNDLLDWVLGSFHKIKHVEVIRLGTRVPVVLPMRINDELCAILAKYRPLWVNTQFNHPAEITDESIRACDLILRHGIPVSNQAVLLKGVNDSVHVMKELCNKLQGNMIRPYYVFECDPVKGTEYLRVSRNIGMQIAEELRKTVGGLSLPKFVVDIAGEKGKVDIRN